MRHGALRQHHCKLVGASTLRERKRPRRPEPISGSLITLYAAGTTGTASTAQSKLSQPVYTNQNGDFTITGLFGCNAGDQLYLTATGGDAGGGSNSVIALMTVLGPCAQYLANANTTFFNVNEVTTVASTSALANFMTGPRNVGSSASQANQLAGAMASVQAMVNPASGAALLTSLGNGIVPQATINSLANSIANCINSQQGTSNCSDLFSVTGGPAGTPTETITAALNVALNPTGNPSGVFLQGTAAPPFMPVLNQAPASFALSVQHPSDVLMYHNDTSRSGVQPYEQALTPSNVNKTQFGKLFTYTVDSYLFAQPLYVGGVGMLDGALHNIVIAATTAGTIYAFDADGNNPAPGPVWSVNYIPSGQRPYTASDLGGCSNPPQAGVLGTPVIDRTTQTLYFVVKSAAMNGSAFYHYLHAVSLVDGSEQPGSPTLIRPTFPATGTGSSNGVYMFNAQAQSQRSALLITPNVGGAEKTIWIAYASQCDAGSYHGLMLAFNGSNVSRMTASFINTPNGNEGRHLGQLGRPGRGLGGVCLRPGRQRHLRRKHQRK